MLILKRVHESNPELHEIRNGGIAVGYVEINWGYCRAYLGERKVYEAYDHKFWNSFNTPGDRTFHLNKIKETLKPLLYLSFDPKQLA